MSLGNTSSPRTNEQYFRRALQLLRAAAAIPNYTLTRYLQQYVLESVLLTESFANNRVDTWTTTVVYLTKGNV